MKKKAEPKLRNMICPYCRYRCQSGGIGAIYCGPHYASHGTNVYPAVRMHEASKTEKEKSDEHPR